MHVQHYHMPKHYLSLISKSGEPPEGFLEEMFRGGPVPGCQLAVCFSHSQHCSSVAITRVSWATHWATSQVPLCSP